MFAKAALIIQQVSLNNGVSVELITSKTRTATVVAARKDAIRRIRAETSLSWAETNQIVGRAKGCHRV
jgi:chromosomal replication initiation ATPase DnaA